MELRNQLLISLTILLLYHYFHEAYARDSRDEIKALNSKVYHTRAQSNVKRSTRNVKGVSKSCSQYGQLGYRENGHCTLYDSKLHLFTAYCDFTSEPGFAWTLVASFSRQMVRTEISKVNEESIDFLSLKQKSFAEDAPVNEKTPNWIAFRYSKQTMQSLKAVSTHIRFTCSEDGPFFEMRNYNDYARVSLSELDPLTAIAEKQTCIKTEFISIRNVSCSGCTVSFTQKKGVSSLHIDLWRSQDICTFAGAAIAGATNVDYFGFYDHYSTLFTCSKHAWSTTQIWFGSTLLPAVLSN